MTVTSTGALRRARAAKRPPKPQPMITTRCRPASPEPRSAPLTSSWCGEGPGERTRDLAHALVGHLGEARADADTGHAEGGEPDDVGRLRPGHQVDRPGRPGHQRAGGLLVADGDGVDAGRAGREVEARTPERLFEPALGRPGLAHVHVDPGVDHEIDAAA